MLELYFRLQANVDLEICSENALDLEDVIVSKLEKRLKITYGITYLVSLLCAVGIVVFSLWITPVYRKGLDFDDWVTWNGLVIGTFLCILTISLSLAFFMLLKAFNLHFPEQLSSVKNNSLAMFLSFFITYAIRTLY